MMTIFKNPDVHLLEMNFWMKTGEKIMGETKMSMSIYDDYGQRLKINPANQNI